MVHDGLDHSQDLNTHILVLLSLDFLETDVQKHIKVVDVEKVLGLFL
jgi:hypothetical protein